MKLSRAQIDALRTGGAPRLAFPGNAPCPLEPGQVISVCSGLELVIQRIRKSKKGELVAHYLIRDFRVRLPRRVPPAHASGKGHLDEHGMPAAPTRGEIERARLEGATTSSKRMAVRGRDLAENLEEQEQRSVTAKAHARWAMNRSEQTADEQKRREQERSIRDRLRLTLQGLDPSARQALLAAIEREILRAQNSLDRAA